MNKEPLKVASATFRLEPPESNGQQELPLTLLVKRMLTCATDHAESWNVGYSTLIRDNRVWVLSRLAVEMTSYPRINEEYTVQTWIEGYNKHFSARNFCFLNQAGEVCGYARTIWVVMDLATRESVDISRFEYIERNVVDKECPMEKQSRVRPLPDNDGVLYRVKYGDIDLNRHMNSVKYIEHLLDLFPLSRYDEYLIHRFEISYVNEARYDIDLTLLKQETAENDFALEMKHDGNSLCRGRIVFSPRKL